MLGLEWHAMLLCGIPENILTVHAGVSVRSQRENEHSVFQVRSLLEQGNEAR